MFASNAVSFLDTFSSTGVSATSTSDLETEKNTEKSSFWEVPYVEALLFSVENLKGTLNLECRLACRCFRQAWPEQPWAATRRWFHGNEQEAQVLDEVEDRCQKGRSRL